jgi:hypothetical protein
VQLLDLMPAFKSQQDWQQRLLEQDGVHLTQDGNNVLFAALMQLIEQHLPDIRCGLCVGRPAGCAACDRSADSCVRALPPGLRVFACATASQLSLSTTQRGETSITSAMAEQRRSAMRRPRLPPPPPASS